MNPANFMSDNASGASVKILAALSEANEGWARAYGGDDLTARAEAVILELFGAPDGLALLTATGTAANALALAAICPPYGAIYCHDEAHINVDECAAPEFFTGGAKLVTLTGEHGKLSAAELNDRLSEPNRGVHQVKPAAVSISQATEAGTVYTLDEIAAIADVAHSHGLKLHMDGARLANALVALDVDPKAMREAGVDVLSFGLSKNGALMAEAVVAFDASDAMRVDLAYRRKRGGHLVSKMRFIAAQWLAALDGGHWLENATLANARAAELGHGLAALDGATLAHPVEANTVFCNLARTTADALEADGFGFYRWDESDDAPDLTVRLVTAFNTEPEAVEAFIASAKRHMD